MKRKVLGWGLGVLMAAALGVLVSGCDHSPSYGGDDPGQGYMSRVTAERIFTWGAAQGGVEIRKFLSAAALKAYLEGGRAAAGGTATLVLNRIDGKSVVGIGERAFSPGAQGGDDDVTTTVRTFSLPETIGSLGANLFAGTANTVTVNIPPAVAERISPAALQSAAGGRATIQKVDPAKPDGSPEVIVRGPSGSGSSGSSGSSGGSSGSSGGSGGSSGGSGGSSGGSGGSTGNNEPAPPPPPPAPVLVEGPVVTYSGGLGGVSLSAAFTFDMAVIVAGDPVPGWTLSGDETATITAVAEGQTPGVPAPLSFTVANSQAPGQTAAVPEIVLMPVAGVFAPQAGAEYTVRYVDRYGAACLAGDGGEGWYYVEDAGLRRLFNAVYAPNAPGSPPDGMGDGKPAVAYTAENKETVSDRALALFKIILGSDRSGDRVEIRGPDLPEAADAGPDKQIVIDIGLPASSGGNALLPEEDNSLLPAFSVPAGGLGAVGGDYAHIRLRVNWGVSLRIEADGLYGNLTNGVAEVMPRGKLRSAAAEGFPLGEGGLIVAQNGSAVGLGPEGWFIGPSSGGSPDILWDGGDQTGNYLEIREDRLAFSASITVRKSLKLKHRVWFVNGPTLTIDAGTSLDGNKGLFARDGAVFYGKADTSGGFYTGSPASTVLVKPGSSVSRSFFTGAGEGEDLITAGNSVIEIRNQGSAGSTPSYYREGPNPIWGYLNWKLP